MNFEEEFTKIVRIIDEDLKHAMKINKLMRSK